MTETGSTVERLRELLGVVVDADTPEERDAAWDEIEQRHRALFAVVEAAQEYEDASNVGPPFSTKRALRIRRARERISKTVAALHSQASDEGNQ